MKKLLFLLAIIYFLFTGFAKGQDTLSAGNKCMECHGKLASKKVVHIPVINDCDKCHQANGKQHPQEDVEGFTLIKEVPQLCFMCHDEANIMKEVIHPPFKEGDCLSCHDVHSSKNEHLVSAIPPGLCYSCHNDLQKTIETAAVGHDAVKEGKSCVNCHSPHSSSEKKILVKAEPDLCLDCHDKPLAIGNRTIPNMKEIITGRKYLHGAIDNNGCSFCHNPHASENKYLLGKAFPVENYSPAKKENYALCLECHESSLFEEQSTTESTGFRNGEKNLHYVHVNQEKGRNCINCHDVHASNNLYLIADQVQFGEWEMPINFTKLPKGGSCATGCHAEKKYER
jgi:predicted CXXCH cytochrome family protein